MSDKTKYFIGQLAIFVEHVVLIKDLDSLMEEPVKVMVLSTIENFEEHAERYGKKESALALSGNSLEAEYIGKTGRTVFAEYAVLKTGWKTVGDKTPDDGSINFDELRKFE